MYYYAILESEFLGFGKIRSSPSLVKARAGLVKALMADYGAETGVVATKKDMDSFLDEDGIGRGVVGYANVRYRMVGGKARKYILWTDAKTDKDYMAKADGALMPVDATGRPRRKA